jgi:hypothetical protein
MAKVGLLKALALLVELPSSTQSGLHPRGDDLIRHVGAGLKVLGGRPEYWG